MKKEEEEENKLISMCDFVECRFEEHSMDNEYASYEFMVECNNFRKFLQQPLELCMFVPCKLVNGVWVAIEKPYKMYSSGLNFNSRKLTKEGRDYKQAKDRVLFEGFTVDSSKSIVSIVGYGIRVFYRDFCCDNIEQLIEIVEENNGIAECSGKTEITLTKTALKQIGL